MTAQPHNRFVFFVSVVVEFVVNGNQALILFSCLERMLITYNHEQFLNLKRLLTCVGLKKILHAKVVNIFGTSSCDIWVYDIWRYLTENLRYRYLSKIMTILRYLMLQPHDITIP